MYEQKHALKSPKKQRGMPVYSQIWVSKKTKTLSECKTVPPLHTIVHPQAQINRTQ